MAEGDYEFRPKPTVLSRVELDEIIRVAPPAEAVGRDLLDQLDEMEEDLKRVREAEKEAISRNEELEESMKEKEQELRKLQTRLNETQDQYDRVRGDFKDLQQRYRTLSQEHDRLRAETALQDTKQQSEWKIERLTKDNRALEVANTDLRKELQTVKEENLEVSEKIVELNHQHQELLNKNVILETRVDEMANDKDNLLSIQDELRTELQDKMNLLDEFEDKFNRQYRSWEDEKAGLLAQIEALRRESAKTRRGGKGEEQSAGRDDANGISAAELSEMRQELNDAREKEAVEEIKALKAALAKEERRTRDLINQINKQAAKVEDLYDENTMLRQRAGLGDNDKVEIKDIKMQKEATIAQLRALNALLERQVSDLEEERRKLRMEMKFRAKYHGQHALEMGLTNEKLLLLEQYADDLKNNRVEEARVVEQMQKREAMEQAVADGVGTPSPGTAALSAIKAKEIEAVQKVTQECMRRLRQMSQSLFEKRDFKDEDYQRYVDAILVELADADKVLEELLKDPAALITAQQGADGALASPGSPGYGLRPSLSAGRTSAIGSSRPGHRPGQAAVQLMPGDASYLADAVADELREKLKGLARQVADLQVETAQKDVRIKQLLEHKAELEKRIGVAAGERKAEYVTMAEYEDVQLEAQGLKEQLISVLEELASREREAAELHDTSLRYHTKMQAFSDQVKLLYREYAGARTAWKVEKITLEKKHRKAQADADAYKIATRELQTALDTLSKSRDLAEVEKEYLDTVRRMAVVQVYHSLVAKHSRLQHEYRKLLEEQADAVGAPGQEEIFRLRDELNSMVTRYDQVARQAEELK
ncbi:hypothetical protein GPECTOR_1g634 [Gonium pectorale]|uniref:Uncharacterized protein n=1 Tax=Gonium pectorale TaxID=33097 RepID=A0A150H3S2_GONPE|nr:hypothetical protein GPECTOR_1g634 [Gonium pectorale]|eukprot:KXZ56704.1 hypothetical protein GPECTOR_1g634 [Gonium pectorale]